jgi:hypothetical protein
LTKKDEPFELNPAQITELVKLAKLTERDVFYDLGSATGKVIIQIAKTAKFKKAIGIEQEREYYEKARIASIDELKPAQLKKIDFWLGHIDFSEDGDSCFDFDTSDGTVFYNSLHEQDMGYIRYYRTYFESRRARIIMKDMPLVGYNSIANRINPDCWFFMMKFPLKRIKSRPKWIKSVLGKDGSIDDLYDYYYKQLLKHYPGERKYVRDVLLMVKRLVNARF